MSSMKMSSKKPMSSMHMSSKKHHSSMHMSSKKHHSSMKMSSKKHHSSMHMSSKKPMSSMKMSSKKPMSSMHMSSKKHHSSMHMSSKTHMMTKTRTPATPSPGIDVNAITDIPALVLTIPRTSNGLTFKDIILEMTTKKQSTTAVKISAILDQASHLDTFVNSMKSSNPSKFLNPKGEIAVSAKGLSVAVAFVNIDINAKDALAQAIKLLCISPICIVELRIVQTTYFFRQANKTE